MPELNRPVKVAAQIGTQHHKAGGAESKEEKLGLETALGLK